MVTSLAVVPVHFLDATSLLSAGFALLNKLYWACRCGTGDALLPASDNYMLKGITLTMGTMSHYEFKRRSWLQVGNQNSKLLNKTKVKENK